MELFQKYEKLKEYIKSLEFVGVAYSSGVDSTFLLNASKEALGDKVIALTAKSFSFPKRELNEAVDFCKKENIKQIIVEFEELNIEGFSDNPKNRCYLCKKELFKKFGEISKKEGIKYIIEGSNLDDNKDYRPGLQAIDELHIKSPLRHIGFTKNEIRILSKELNLYTFNKQSFACLSSRFPYGEKITKEKLLAVDKSEQFLLDLGFRQVRVRIHDNLARIEVEPDEFEKLLKNRDKIIKEFKENGFIYISLDIEGYRTGSMNEVLSEDIKNEV